MITTLKKGLCKLVETRSGTKILVLDDAESYAWVHAKNIGSLLVLAGLPKNYINVFSQGDYRLYDVTGEPKLSDLEHLELHAGARKWQGYLLLSGLPTKAHRKTRIIPTSELIVKSKSHTPSFWQNHMKVFSGYVQLANNPRLLFIQ